MDRWLTAKYSAFSAAHLLKHTFIKGMEISTDERSRRTRHERAGKKRLDGARTYAHGKSASIQLPFARGRELVWKNTAEEEVIRRGNFEHYQ